MNGFDSRYLLKRNIGGNLKEMAYFLGFSAFLLLKNTFILPPYTRNLHNFYTEITQDLHRKKGAPKHSPLD